MLRQIENFSGLLILLTDRVGAFNEGFMSRIHIALHFPQLNTESAMQVWRVCLRRLQTQDDVDVDTPDIMAFAKELVSNSSQMWNGRRIKVACDSAATLARYDTECYTDGKPTLKVDHFKTVAHASQDFQEYMSAVSGPSEVARAWSRPARRDDYSAQAGDDEDEENVSTGYIPASAERFYKRGSTVPTSTHRASTSQASHRSESDSDSQELELEQQLLEVKLKLRRKKRSNKLR